jgi:cob(I)alamin adenosyltransferase
MSISTGRGDGGKTDLRGGQRVSKDHLRIELCGHLDELAAGLGVARAHLTGIGPPDSGLTDSGLPDGGLSHIGESIKSDLGKIQDHLLSLGAILAKPADMETEPIWPGSDESIAYLDSKIQELEAKLPPLRNFIRPAGPPPAAFLHSSRTICRRAERRLVTLRREEPLPPAALTYLNRLGDLLFLWAREVQLALNIPEEPWENGSL